MTLTVRKTELRSLRVVSKDSTAILAEKLALSREMSVMKAEVEHLRAQCTVGEKLLAEKLSLQRELNTVRVELETEQRSLQRAISKEHERSTDHVHLKSQLELLQSDLARERKDCQRYESEGRKLKVELESQRNLLESKIDALRVRLKTTREQLKEVQTTSRSSLANHSTFNLVQVAKNPKNRNIQQVREDTAIGTPGTMPATKKLRRGSALPGDKSLFSITPFLNRTAILPPNRSPQASDEPASEHSEDSRTTVTSSPVEYASGKKEMKPPRIKPVFNAKNLTRSRSRGGNKKPTSLDRVPEEILDTALLSPIYTVEPDTAANGGGVRGHPQIDEIAMGFLNKKKRKILGPASGRMIFEDDEGRADKAERPAKSGFVGSHRITLAPRGGRPPAGLLKEFSPLKKDRRRTGSGPESWLQTA